MTPKTVNQPDTPEGRRFSHVYIERGKPVSDSPRMRRRIASLIKASHAGGLSEVAEVKLGIQGPWSSTRDWIHFLSIWELTDVLDLVTIAYKFFESKERSDAFSFRGAASKWAHEVDAIFEEENVHYRVDSSGGVHFRYDAEFSRNTVATIASLNDGRYAAALHSFSTGLSYLAKGPPDGRSAIRHVFDAIEGLFRLSFPTSPRLAKSELSKLSLLLKRRYAQDDQALRAAEKLSRSFGEWIDSAHNYRHADGSEGPTQAPLDLAVGLVSHGAAYLRWIAEIDAYAEKEKPAS